MATVAFLLNPSTWILVGLVLLTGILLFRAQRQLGARRRANAEHLVTAGVAGRRRVPIPAPDDVVAWQVEMQELARELAAQLDSKMVLLQQLIRDADRAAASLETASSVRGGGCDKATGPDERAVISHPLEREEEPVGTPPSSMPREPSDRDRYEEIYTLCDYGFSPQEIAGKVGNTTGEVELILALRERRQP